MHNLTQDKALVAIMLGGKRDRKGGMRGGDEMLSLLNVVNVVPNKKYTVQGSLR